MILLRQGYGGQVGGRRSGVGGRGSVTFQWSAASDPEGGVSGYHLRVGTTPGGNDLFDSQTATTSQTVTVLFGTTLHAQARQINNAGIAGSYSVASDAVLALDRLPKVLSFSRTEI